MRALLAAILCVGAGLAMPPAAAEDECLPGLCDVELIAVCDGRPSTRPCPPDLGGTIARKLLCELGLASCPEAPFRTLRRCDLSWSFDRCEEHLRWLLTP